MRARSSLAALPRLDDDQFSLWAQLLQQWTGILWPLSRKSFLETRLRLRMQELGFSDYRTFYRYLFARGQGDEEWVTLIDRLTIHETRFFRHPPSFALVRERVLPRDAPAYGVTIEFSAWSVGCATGEEPYSLAMVLKDHFSAMVCPYDFRIWASDISLPTLITAKQGIYPRHRVKEVPMAMQLRHLKPLADGRYQIVQDLRERVHFEHANALCGGQAAWGRVDLILCQNVLMYFAHEQRAVLLNHLVEHLVPDGKLILGPGEVLRWSHPEMERMAFPNTLAFRRASIPSCKRLDANHHQVY